MLHLLFRSQLIVVISNVYIWSIKKICARTKTFYAVVEERHFSFPCTWWKAFQADWNRFRSSVLSPLLEFPRFWHYQIAGVSARVYICSRFEEGVHSEWFVDVEHVASCIRHWIMGNKITRRRLPAIDDRHTRPQGLYPCKDVDQQKLRRLILDSKLAPCYPGGEEPAVELEECPICFLVQCQYLITFFSPLSGIQHF